MHTRIISAQRRACIRCLLPLSLYLVLVGLPYSPEWCYMVPEAPPSPAFEWPLQAHFRTTSSPAPLTPFLLRCRWLPWLQFLLVALALNRLLLPLPQHERQAPPLLYTNLDSTEIGSHGQGLGKGHSFVEGASGYLRWGLTLRKRWQELEVLLENDSG